MNIQQQIEKKQSEITKKIEEFSLLQQKSNQIQEEIKKLESEFHGLLQDKNNEDLSKAYMAYSRRGKFTVIDGGKNT